MRCSRRLAASAASATVLVAALLLTGCATTGLAAPAMASATPEVTRNPFAAGGLQDPRSAEVEAQSASALPTRIRIPSIGVDASLEDLAIGDGGRLDAPVDYDSAGWFADGVVPGRVGPAIIAGHVDSPTAPAVFARIAELAAGDQVLITMSDGTQLAFDVTGTTQSAKSEFPTAEVYSTVPAPELRLITCAGTFDSAIGHYTDNLIVFAALS